MGMNKLNTAERVQIISALVEGNSINSTCRMTGRSKHTVLNLLADIGKACKEYHDQYVRGLCCKRIQVDEVWDFCYCKQKNIPAEMQGVFGVGDVWTWTAVDADTKLIVSYLIGLRDGGYATDFVRDIKNRLINRPQLTSDGHRAYLEAVEDAFGGDVDYAQLIKVYGVERAGEARYSPPVCLAAEPHPICGDPDPAHIVAGRAKTGQRGALKTGQCCDAYTSSVWFRATFH
jgi:IS1 family transposase